MEISISPYSTNKTKPFPHDYATKVQLFWERFHGWKFDIATKMLDGYETEETKKVPGIPHSGYAAMDTMFSYFEPLGKHLDGYLDPDDVRKSGHYFKEGMKNIFGFSGHDSGTVDKLLDVLWTGIRCGLYHSGQTKKGVLISGGTKEAIRFATADEIVIVNPHKLAEGLIRHVADYRDRLLKEGRIRFSERISLHAMTTRIQRTNGANKITAANARMAPQFHAGRHWLGVTEFCR